MEKNNPFLVVLFWVFPNPWKEHRGACPGMFLAHFGVKPQGLQCGRGS